MTLRYVSTIAWTGFATVSVALIYAFTNGHFATDWAKLVDNPLGLATLIDVYVGFALFSCWILWREARLAVALPWIALLALGGNLVSPLYVLAALHTSNGNIEEFWLGSKYMASKNSKLHSNGS